MEGNIFFVKFSFLTEYLPFIQPYYPKAKCIHKYESLGDDGTNLFG